MNIDFLQIVSNFLCAYLSSQIKPMVALTGIFVNSDSAFLFSSSSEMGTRLNIDGKS